MYHIAVVEDERRAAEEISDMVSRYFAERNIRINVSYFDSAESFLWKYKSDYDVVFMDIDLPGENGLEAARKMRKLDKTTVLVFVTNMAQFAVKGYEVDALDFIVKPVDYDSVAIKMMRVAERLKTRTEQGVSIMTPTGMRRLDISQIKYVEVLGHKVTYHTEDGDISATGSLKSVEQKFSDANFSRCNHCYLVNLRFVRGINGYSVKVGNEELPISRSRRKEFLTSVNNFFGGGGV